MDAGARLKAVIEQHWGFHTLRPLQEPAMRAVLEGRDSLVVMPTGGGKSLCYQAPAVSCGDTTVVVSPLISLMKDQVDSLRAIGVAAAAMNSSLSVSEMSDCERALLQGKIRLLFLSPERLVMPGMQQLLRQAKVRTFAIDEAHCISHWGHDFRKEYRQLSQLKRLFPQASVHGYTATATEQVRRDIAEQLTLKNPAVLVGNFDRPNLNYRVLPRRDSMRQVQDVLERHRGEAGILYCMRRRDVDELTADLRALKYNALAYHAGLSQDLRRSAQDAFAEEKCDLIVATVAFGMGIDRSNIRFILHTAMPKSIEHYQQETGRAGRDGLEAECVLLHSGRDFLNWQALLRKSADEARTPPEVQESLLRHLEDMDRYCRGAVCRHRALVEYFGQQYEPASCAACDLCLGDTELAPDALVLAQKILSCVARVKERFGIGQVISVLRGENTDKVRQYQHNQLSTYGLLKEHRAPELRDWIYQLIGQKVLLQEIPEGFDYPILKLNPASWEVMKGQRQVRLVSPAKKRAEKSKADTASWEGVDKDLFEVLRELRKKLAEERDVPPYVIFSDATLRELARVRPSTRDRLRLIYGIGDVKLQDFGELFLKAIQEHCRQHGLAMDQKSQPAPPTSKASVRPGRLAGYFGHFRQGKSIEAVMQETGRTRSTVVEYLAEFIRETRPQSISHWVRPEIYEQVAQAARKLGTDRLKPVFVELNEQVPYAEIRLVVAHLSAT